MINTIKIHLLPNFEEAIKFGYLNKLSSKLGVKKFIIRFVVLTNVGLFDYENPGKNPKNFISLINCKINTNLFGKYKLSFVFEIVGINAFKGTLNAKGELGINGSRGLPAGRHTEILCPNG